MMTGPASAFLPTSFTISLSLPKISSATDSYAGNESGIIIAMFATLRLIGTFVVDLLFRSQRQLEVENLFLRHQLNIAVRRAPQRIRLSPCDQALLIWVKDQQMRGTITA
jgi:hypothetical protein